MKYISYEGLKSEICKLKLTKNQIIVALDGRCAAGKSTLAQELERELGATVFHIDDFFLTPSQRTPERLGEVGGNFDRERFLSEVLLPLSRDLPVSYRAYNCKSNSFSPKQTVERTAVTVIEGSYSCHPELADYYDLKIFVDVSKERQRDRIVSREGAERSEIFFSRWIPFEERYFDAFNIRETCDFVLTT